ncbi:MAG: hypothetical protein PHS82_15280 [Lachnospiraceae bacterium]|nr:hypothetical protein [Lachnospiraceae bacterium]
MRDKKKKAAHPVYTSILLLLCAVAAVTAVTIAWLSIADSTRVRSMNLDVTSGVSLRFDLDPHATFDEYIQTLTFPQIAARLQQDKGFSMEQTPLEPVTTSNFTEFTLENGTVVSSQSGAYLEFELNFMASRDMIVHLSSANGANGQNGTVVSSDNAALPQAMRISFTVDGTTSIYDPGMGQGSTDYKGGKFFGLPSTGMVYGDDNALFSLKEGVNKTALVHVWLEGTDEACTDALKGADYSISLRFEGTDENNQLFEEAEER